MTLVPRFYIIFSLAEGFMLCLQVTFKSKGSEKAQPVLLQLSVRVTGEKQTSFMTSLLSQFPHSRSEISLGCYEN